MMGYYLGFVPEIQISKGCMYSGGQVILAASGTTEVDAGTAKRKCLLCLPCAASRAQSHMRISLRPTGWNASLHMC